MSLFRTFKVIFEKILLNARLDLKWLFFNRPHPPVNFAQRFSYLFRKYKSILSGSYQTRFFDSLFGYDNLLTPALLPDYVFELYGLREYLRLGQSNTLLDIGANVGQFAFTASKLYPHLSIYSFEPNPSIFSVLNENAKAHNQWQCFNFGLGQDNASFPFYFVQGKSGQGSVFKANASQGLVSQNVTEISVEIKKISPELFKSLDLPLHFDFIKIDIEGAERQVLAGLGALTWKYLYIELSEGREGGISLSECLNLLKGQNGDFEIVVRVQSAPEGAGQTFQTLFERISRFEQNGVDNPAYTHSNGPQR